MSGTTSVSQSITVTCHQHNRVREKRRFRVQAIQDIHLLTRHSFAGSLAQVLQTLADKDSNHRKIAAAIEKDLHFRLSLQHVAGSAFYRPRALMRDDSPIDLESCMRILGREAVTYLALRQGILRLSPQAGDLAAPLVAHLFVTAEIARQLGRERGQKAGDRAYLAGLMHDFGKLALLQAAPEIYGEIAALCRRESLPTRDAEREMLVSDIVEHADHAYFGARLLELACIDEETVEAVRRHHDPLPDVDPEEPHLTLGEIVQIADLLANRAGFSDGFAHRPTGACEDPAILSRLKFGPERQNEIVDLAVKKAAEAVDAVTDRRADRRQREWNEQVRRLLQGGAARGEEAAAPTDKWLAMLDFLADREKASLVRLMDFTGKNEDEVRGVLDRLTDAGYLDYRRDSDSVPVWRARPRLGRTPLHELLTDLTADEAAAPPKPSGPGFLSRCEGGEVVPLSIPEDEYVDAVWSPDGARLALRRRNGEIVQWLVDEDRAATRIPAASSRVTSMTWSADSRTLMMGTEFGEIIVVPRGRWERSQRIDTGPYAILACALSTANDLLATGAKDGGVRLWRRGHEGVQEVELGRHRALVNDLAWSRDGSRLASAAADGTARIWDPENGELLEILAGQSSSVRRVAWSPDNRLLATGSADGLVRIWGVDKRNYSVRLDPGGGPITRLSFSADGMLLAAQDQDGVTTFWHTAQWRTLGRQVPDAGADGYRHQEGCLAFHPWTNQVLVAGATAAPQCLRWQTEGVAELVEQASNGEWSVQLKRIGPRDEQPGEVLTIVHLSDLHFREQDDVDPRVTHLLNDLKVQVGVPRVDFIVISGDLVNQARKAEYRTARWFVEALRQRLRLDRDRVLIVPGNHDVNWAEGTCQCADPVACPRIQGALECRCAGDQPNAEACAEAYRRRFQNFGQELYRYVQDEPFALEYGQQILDRPFRDAGVRFVGYNSAWRTDRNQPQAIDVNEEAKTTLAERQLTWESEPLLNIGILHHPVHYGSESVPSDFVGHLDRMDIKLALNGHIHQGSAEYTGFLRRGGTVLLATGSFDGESQGLPAGVRQEYQILRMNVAEGRTIVTSRHKNPNQREWEENFRWDGATGGKHSSVELSLA